MLSARAQVFHQALGAETEVHIDGADHVHKNAHHFDVDRQAQ